MLATNVFTPTSEMLSCRECNCWFLYFKSKIPTCLNVILSEYDTLLIEISWSNAIRFLWYEDEVQCESG